MAQSGLLRLVPEASAPVCALLDARRGAVQPPIRSEIFGPQRFAQHGRSLGATHRAGRASWRTPSFFPRLRGNIRVLREAHRYIGAQAATGYDISPAAEWLLDNFHLVEAQLEEVHKGLPGSYFRALPMLLDEPLAGLPRVYGVAWAFVAHTDGAFDEALLVQFLAAYQETRPLDLSEMWALPTTLRVVLVESLRRLAERVATNKAAREVANLCCDHIERYDVAALDALRAFLDQRGVGRVFLAQMALRLRDSVSRAHPGYAAWLSGTLPEAAALQAQQGADQAADNLSVSNALRSLRAIGDADWPDIVGRTSTLMQLLLTAQSFEADHVSTRNQTLHAIERLSRQSGLGEMQVARTLLQHMRRGDGGADDVSAGAGHWLQGPGRPELMRALGQSERVAVAWRALRRPAALPVYLGALLCGSVGLVAWMLLHQPAASAAWPGWTVLGAVLMLFPASEAVVAVLHRLIGESVRPAHLPRLALAQGIPREHRVLVVIPALLTDAASIRDLVHRLQLHHLANPEPFAQFALLTDGADADSPELASDAALLASALQQIGDLNKRYPRPDGDFGAAPRFILLHRERDYSPTERRWIGWERKRGKLELLVAALAQRSGDSASAFLPLGELSRIAEATPYIVTLDSDTQLPPGRLRELVGVAAHPQNRPRLGAGGRTVVSGYGILQPRIVTPLPNPRDFTIYHWLFAGQCGIDPYSAASSEVYQDLFGEGSFTGKGLLDVQAMHTVLSGGLPEGQVLSHDLLEGAMARCAAVTDLALIEDAPFHADVAASRVHRWTRGDWQLLPFLLSPLLSPLRHSLRLRAVNRWKMVDNLRRSLVAPTSLGLLLLSLAGFALSPWAALALVLAAFTAGPLMSAVAGLSPSRDDIAKRHFYRQGATELARALLGGLWHLGQLLNAATMAVDAIVRALYRMLVSHRHLLQWTTAAAAQAQARSDLRSVLRRHWSLPPAALLLAAALWAAGTPNPVLVLVLCTLWAASPVWTWWVSRRPPDSEDATLPLPDQALLHDIARDTWRYFERVVGADDRHLPPDNLQMAPHEMLARRTSPTNIGLYLLAATCARQFGWIGTLDLVARLEATLDTLDTLQRHRGHFLNWYDTQSGAPLLPMYVSTVDSGNLGGHLLAVAAACRERALRPGDISAGLAARRASAARLSALLPLARRRLPAQRQALRWALADHRATLASAALDLPLAAHGAAEAAALRLLAVAGRCERLAAEADYAFLYHPSRHLLHIGYRVAEQTLDASYYDLLASESRLTSLLAVATGDVPVRHWASLGRPFFAVGAQAGLRSWSGSMFEYLMPTLVLDEPHGSVLRDACHAALREQMAFAQTQGVPWGISESAYAGSDHTLAYQYAPQGVPRLALRRTPADEVVVAPYATALAAMIAPRRACLNFALLQAQGARGRYGFIEALDYTPARQVAGGRCTPVSTYMAHHQGMSIVALANVLLDGCAQRWGMAPPAIEAMVSLLHERAPREVSNLSKPPASAPPKSQQRRAPGLLREVTPGSTAVEPTHLLGNGRYSVALRANGAGWSRWGAVGITRWRDDALRDAFGSFVYLRPGAGAQPGGHASPVSITQHPAPDAMAHYQSSFHADRVCFEATWPHLHVQMTVWVSPEDDIEFRQVELRNDGERALDIELVSAFEVTLAEARADEAHPAFTSLFVRAEWLAAQQALLFSRQPRLPSEQALQAAHFIAGGDAPVLGVRVLTDRQRWLGRNRAASAPRADFDDPAGPSEHAAAHAADATPADTHLLDTGLDPMCAMAVRLRIEPGAKAQLTFATAASDNAATLRAVIDKYRQPSHVQRASLMSATLTGIRLRELNISAENFAVVQTLSTALAMSLSRPHGPARRLPGLDGADGGDGACDRRLLWRFGISGDRPLILVSAGSTQGLGLLRALAQALRLWAWGGLACDLVVLNTEATSYQMPLQREVASLRERHTAEAGAAGPTGTGLHLLRADELSADELSTLQLLARVRLQADGRPLLHHVQAWCALHEHALDERRAVSGTALAPAAAGAAEASVSEGTFDADTGEFRFAVGDAMRPRRPWINVLANAGFGAQVSEAGGGYTWARNSRMNQLTAWSNDPVADAPAEWFLLQDLRTGVPWSVAPSALGGAPVAYRVAHGQGYSIIGHRRGDLEVTVSWCVDPDSAVKQVRLRLVNRGHRTQRLRVIGVAEWMMGANRSDRATTHTASYRPPGLTALLCTQRERSAGFGNGTAFLALADGERHREGRSEATDWTCDRRELFDARGRLLLPDDFAQRSGDGLDPCAALSTTLALAAGDSVERVFLLGFADSPAAARQLVTQATAVPALQRLESVRERWETLLGATRVKTPDALFDVMVNRWLLYQTVTCRLWAKAGFYQAGGATGFRDQLQDAMALAWAAPDMLRAQILVCASRQFAAGDVQHWWHAPTGAGVRTHFSDDLLWLPWACVHHLRCTGDATLLDESVPFLDGAEIPPGAEDAYYVPTVSAESASVYEHAARTIDRSLRTGVHGLPLMGSGDWNDGMNRVGIEGRGESVWLGWFLCRLVADFAPLAHARGDTERALRWEQAAAGWAAALNGAAWDGAWFKRAFFDDGSPLGSHVNDEAQIDLIAQAWAVLSGAAPVALQRMALAAVQTHLVDADAGLIRLLHPPLAHAVPSAGYIQAYPPGVRENGGQYSHAGVWALMAQAEFARLHPGQGHAQDVDPDTAYRSFTWLSPAHRSAHPVQGPAYAIEPYVMAGDVYTQPPHVGRGGWSWYTGSAAWMHRAAIESLFGLRLAARQLSFEPVLPSHWPLAELTLKRDGRSLHFVFVRSAPGQALAAAAPALAGADAAILLPGQPLQWAEGAAQTHHVIPLLAA